MSPSLRPLAAAAAALVFAAAPAAAAKAPFEAGRLLVKPARGVDKVAVLDELGVTLVRPSLFGWLVVSVNAGTEAATARELDRIRKSPLVDAADPILHEQALRTPNDEGWQYLWGMQDIGADQAWDTTVGNPDQRIGMVDSGLVVHQDLTPADLEGWDFIEDATFSEDGDGRDSNYTDTSADHTFHGPHVAGTMIAEAQNGVGVVGLNWEARLVTVRALSSGDGSLVDIAEGAAWLAGFHVDGVPDIGEDHVSVINLSLGGDGACTSFEQDIYSRILATGVSVVAATGNDPGSPTSTPANCAGVIAVGAHGPTYQIAPYSGRDARVDVFAPGGDDGAGYDIYGEILSVNGEQQDQYMFLQGTSMASPHVAGTVSLMQAVNPLLSPQQIRVIISSSPYGCTGCGSRASLDAFDAVSRALVTQGALPAEPGTGALVPINDDGGADPGTGDPGTINPGDPNPDPGTVFDPGTDPGTGGTTPPAPGDDSIPPSGDDTCPVNSIRTGLNCTCVSGFHVATSGASCVADAAPDPSDPGDPGDPGTVDPTPGDGGDDGGPVTDPGHPVDSGDDGFVPGEITYSSNGGGGGGDDGGCSAVNNGSTSAAAAALLAVLAAAGARRRRHHSGAR